MDFRPRTVFFLAPWCILLHPTNTIAQFRERERTYDVLHYAIAISIDEQHRSVAGTVAMRFVPLKQLDTIEIDAAEMAISDIASGKTGARLPYTQTGEKLFVTMPAAVKTTDTLLLTIHYS